MKYLDSLLEEANVLGVILGLVGGGFLLYTAFMNPELLLPMYPLIKACYYLSGAILILYMIKSIHRVDSPGFIRNVATQALFLLYFSILLRVL